VHGSGWILKDDLIHVDHVEFDKGRFRRYIGNIGEMVAQEALEKRGFKVWVITPYYTHMGFEESSQFESQSLTDAWKNEEKRVELVNFFGDKMEAFKQYVSSLGLVGKTGVPRVSDALGMRVTRSDLESKYLYCPDLVAKKDERIYVVKIKVGQGVYYLKGNTRKGLLLAKDYGFIPLLITLSVDIEASNLQIREL